ncbi:MAG: PHP domain-containing protein [Ruminococcaceae bacterium]|nr:PHP domain-containing protein [Oscillospiraceae bacterium]
MVTDLSYDLHIHSCLSPCGDDDMTPANIAGMAHIKGLDVAALTDHNTCKNCPAFFEACEYYGVVPVAGMELTTAEDIHMIALFPELSSAMNFSAEIEKHMFRIKNDPDIFGRQLILDCEDRIIGEEENLLVNATDLDVDSAVNLCKSLGGIMYPAHIDRNSNGMAAILGGIHYSA